MEFCGVLWRSSLCLPVSFPYHCEFPFVALDDESERDTHLVYQMSYSPMLIIEGQSDVSLFRACFLKKSNELDLFKLWRANLITKTMSAMHTEKKRILMS